MKLIDEQRKEVSDLRSVETSESVTAQELLLSRHGKEVEHPAEEPFDSVWVLVRDPSNPSSLLTVAVDGGGLAVLLFTRQDFADEFHFASLGQPAGAVAILIEASRVPAVLREQIDRGLTHVITDPIPGSERYFDVRTFTIADYLHRFAST